MKNTNINKKAHLNVSFEPVIVVLAFIELFHKFKT